MAVIFLEQGQRRIPVQYAKRVVGRRMTSGGSTYIPLKVNQAGVIPIIFASSLLYFPTLVASVYHAESGQEAFLVLSGECRLLVEGEERRLREWDFFHCPPWTEHAFVGADEGHCVILMVGARSGPGVRYPVSELAARYGASVDEETSDWRRAYATIERFRRERPSSWSRLPWA